MKGKKILVGMMIGIVIGIVVSFPKPIIHKASAYIVTYGTLDNETQVLSHTYVLGEGDSQEFQFQYPLRLSRISFTVMGQEQREEQEKLLEQERLWND